MPDGLRLNFSGREASAEGRSVELLPRGDYHVICSDGEVRECGPESENAGKEYWNLEFTVQTGEYTGRKVWTNVMLFEGALYTLTQIMKALGYDVDEGENEVPDLEEVIGKHFIVGVTIKPKTEKYDASNNIRGVRKFSADALKSPSGTKKSKANSLLP